LGAFEEATMADKTAVTIHYTRPETLTKARENGEKNSPPSDATAPDEVETNVKVVFLAHFDQDAKPILQEGDKIGEELTARHSDAAGIEASYHTLNTVDDLKGAVEARLAGKQSDFVALKRHEILAKQEWDNFRTEHNVTRLPHKEKNAFDVLALIIVFFIIETVANASFYASGIGLLGGAGIALLFSFVTAAIGFGAGFLTRYRNSTVLWQRVAGWLSAVLGVVVSVYLSSVTATFRALIERNANPDIPGEGLRQFERAMQDGWLIFTGHIPFPEIYATLLFFIALAAFVNAAIAGYNFKDPIPGYSRVSRVYKDAEDNVHAGERDLRGTLREEAEKMRRDRATLINGITATGKAHATLTVRLENCFAKLGQLARQNNADYVQLIREYRATNSLWRATPPPPYFATDPEDLPLQTRPATMVATEDGLGRLKQLEVRLLDLLDPLKKQNTEIAQREAELHPMIDDFQTRCRALALDDINADIRHAGPRAPAGVQ
jgi:hypothetical protein